MSLDHVLSQNTVFRWGFMKFTGPSMSIGGGPDRTAPISKLPTVRQVHLKFFWPLDTTLTESIEKIRGWQRFCGVVSGNRTISLDADHSGDLWAFFRFLLSFLGAEKIKLKVGAILGAANDHFCQELVIICLQNHPWCDLYISDFKNG